MFAKPQWFSRRKYGGWGLQPKTWQGWAYVVVAILPVIALEYLPLAEKTRFVLTVLWLGVFMIDVFHAMTGVARDERERLHEALAERNALWCLIAALVIGTLWRVITTGNPQTAIDPVVLVALGAAVIAKAVTNIYLDRRH